MAEQDGASNSNLGPGWRDLPSYIIGITKEIWEDRQIDALHRYYAQDIIVRSPAGLARGNRDVIAATMATLAEFPDRELLAEDVIWSTTEQGGFLSSHRILSVATHQNDGVYGRATGKQLRYRVLADCHVAAGKIDDEWLIRDQGAIARQLGMSPEAYAREQIAAEGGAEHCQKPLTAATDQNGAYCGRGNDNTWGQQYAELLNQLMNANFASIPRTYDRGCQLEYPGGETRHGWAAADQFWLGLRASFPDATFTIQHQIGRDSDPLLPPRAALRWSLSGRHSGWGRFGRPTGAMIDLMAISQVEFGPYGIRREYVLFDETALWKQILLAQS